MNPNPTLPPLDFTDPATGLLYNAVGASNQDHLDRIEHDVSIERFQELRHPRSATPDPAVQMPALPAAFNEDYVRHMHGFLFQDVYPTWAGETRADRTFQGAKEAPGRAGYFMSYAHYRQISPDLAAVSAQLGQENNLRGLDQAQFAKRAAYYLDHFNHIHAFREGNGRTVQAIFFELGRQAGYQIDLTPDFREFNPARDEALIGYSSNPHHNLARLESLLNRFVQPRPGADAAVARHPVQARPLGGTTPEVARLEALRELKASSQAVNIRLNALRQTRKGDPLHDALFVNLQRTVMANPVAIGRFAPALHRQAEEAALAPATIGNGQAHLERFEQAIDHTVRLFAGQGQQHSLPAIEVEKPPQEEAKRKAPAEMPQQIAVAPKRQGPKM